MPSRIPTYPDSRLMDKYLHRRILTSYPPSNLPNKEQHHETFTCIFEKANLPFSETAIPTLEVKPGPSKERVFLEFVDCKL